MEFRFYYEHDYPDLLTVDQVAYIFGVTVPTVYNLIKRGKLEPGIKFSTKRVRWKKEYIQEYIEKPSFIRWKNSIKPYQNKYKSIAGDF